MTKFFEVSSVSATHIYHSALELTPLSSAVRRLYYHQKITPSPRVVIGTPDSWQPSIAISNKDFPYRSFAWSPCGQFIAAQTQEVVEIRDPFTSELLSTLPGGSRNREWWMVFLATEGQAAAIVFGPYHQCNQWRVPFHRSSLL